LIFNKFIFGMYLAFVLLMRIFCAWARHFEGRSKMEYFMIARRFRTVGAAAAMGAILAAAGTANAITTIELTPTDVGSGSSSVFTTLPTDNPGLFGITGSDIRFVDFDFDPFGTAIPSGTALTNQYSSIGVTMNSIVVSSSVFGGPASPPNATTTPFTPGLDLIFNFTVPVVGFGAINTSPDADVLEFWSGPNGTGTLLLSFADQGGTASPNFNIDRFVGGLIDGTDAIQSVVYVNATGQIELDEFIFAVELDFNDPPPNPNPDGVPAPPALPILLLGLVGLGWARRRRS